MKKKGKTERGLSIIEIIVILLAVVGVMVLLFPIIVRHVRNNRMQEDMTMAREIAVVMTEVLADEKIRDNAVEHATPQLVANMDGSDFKRAVYSALELEEIKGKTTKDVDGEALLVPEFYYTLSVSKRQIEIYYGGITEEYKIYPKAGNKLVK